MFLGHRYVVLLYDGLFVEHLESNVYQVKSFTLGLEVLDENILCRAG